MMVRTLHVDRVLEPPLPLGDVVRDIGQEVGKLAALLRALAHHAVLVVTEIGGAQPQRTVALVRVSSRHETTGRLFHLPVGVE